MKVYLSNNVLIKIFNWFKRLNRLRNVHVLNTELPIGPWRVYPEELFLFGLFNTFKNYVDLHDGLIFYKEQITRLECLIEEYTLYPKANRSNLRNHKKNLKNTLIIVELYEWWEVQKQSNNIEIFHLDNFNNETDINKLDELENILWVFRDNMQKQNIIMMKKLIDISSTLTGCVNLSC